MSPDDPRTRRGLSPGPAQHLHGGHAEVGRLVLQYAVSKYEYTKIFVFVIASY